VGGCPRDEVVRHQAAESFLPGQSKCCVSELRSRIVPTQHSISLSPLWERGGVRGTVRLATLVAPSPAPSPIQGEGKKMSVTVFEKRSTKG